MNTFILTKWKNIFQKSTYCRDQGNGEGIRTASKCFRTARLKGEEGQERMKSSAKASLGNEGPEKEMT